MTDYIPVSQTVTFSPGEMMKQVVVTILDDRSMPMVEGAETFRLALRIPENAMLGKWWLALKNNSETFCLFAFLGVLHMFLIAFKPGY